MLHFIVIAEFIKVLNPYARIYLLNTLDPFECLFLNAIIVLIMSSIYLGYRVLAKGYKIKTTVSKITSFSSNQFLFAIWIGLATILTSMVMLTMDKHYNTPLINSMLFKVVSVILLLITGVVFFKETYNVEQIIGVVLVIIGSSFIFSNKNVSMIKPTRTTI